MWERGGGDEAGVNTMICFAMRSVVMLVQGHLLAHSTCEHHGHTAAEGCGEEGVGQQQMKQEGDTILWRVVRVEITALKQLRRRWGDASATDAAGNE